MSTKVIEVNDIQGNFYGGMPYNVNWSFGNGPEPSRLSVSVVNENGIYQKPNLTFDKVETVKIGNFNFEGYLVKYNINKTPSQKILELEFLDKAVNLEKYYVALHKKHGDKTKKTFPNLILVGKEYHPCDPNLDSIIDYNETRIQIDPCDPCPFMPEDKYASACDPILKDFEIFEVYYTFNELISKFPKEFIISIPDASKYKNFKAQHIGSLKNVLDSWCSDLGLSYFWDPLQKKLIFQDRSLPIDIPSVPDNPDIIDVSEGSSIENTFDRGFIGSFEKNGEIKSYSCENEAYQTLKVLTVGDLFEPVSSGLSNPEVPLKADIKELIAAVSYLGESARNAFIWFWGYGNLTAENTEEKIIPDIIDKTANQSNRGSVIQELGNMTIKKVFHSKSSDPKDIATFNELVGSIPKIDRDRMNAEDLKEGYTAKNPSYYFFVAEVNEELAQRQSETDINLARNFLGRFWFKKLNPSSKLPVPGASNSNTELTIDTPEGSAQWYRVDQDITTLPIFNFGHEEKSPIGQIIKNLDKESKENEDLEEKNRKASQNFGQSVETLRNLNSFILLERDAKWEPNEDFLKWYDNLFKWYKDYSPQIFSSTDGRPNILNSIYPGASNNSNIKLFIVRELKNFDVKFSQVRNHPLEPKSRKTRNKEIQDVVGNTILIKDRTWGLLGSQCIAIEIRANQTKKEKPDIVFHCPVQCFGNNKFLSGLSDDDQGYRVFVKASANFPKVLPKIQYTYTKDPSPKGVGKIDYEIKQITEDNISLLNNNNKQCLVNKQQFEQYAQKILEFSNFRMDQPQKTLVYKIAGVFPEIYNAAQGLSSVQINVTDDGVYTTYSFEDLINKPPSDSYIDQYLKDIMLSKKTIGYLNPLTKNQRSYIKTAVDSVQK